MDWAYRDEIYMQVMRQLTKNPSNSSQELGWELLHQLTISRPPSQVTREFVRAFTMQSSIRLMADERTAAWAQTATRLVLEKIGAAPRNTEAAPLLANDAAGLWVPAKSPSSVRTIHGKFLTWQDGVVTELRLTSASGFE